MKQGSNILRDSFSSKDNVNVPTQFRREILFKALKIRFFIKERLAHFHINITTVTKAVS